MFVSEDRPSRRTTDFPINQTARTQETALCYGRFLQPDPLGYEDSMNMYNYAGSNPVNLVDPTGQRAATPGEGRWINKTFGGFLDDAAASPFFIRGEAWGGYSHVAPPSDIYFTRSFYADDYSKPVFLYQRETFYHEVWHVFEMKAGISSFTSLALNQAISLATGSDPYTVKDGVSFMNQNPEARADIFAEAVQKSDFSAMNGFTATPNSQTKITVREGVLRISTTPTGSLIPRTTTIGSPSRGGAPTGPTGDKAHVKKK